MKNIAFKKYIYIYIIDKKEYWLPLQYSILNINIIGRHIDTKIYIITAYSGKGDFKKLEMSSIANP